MKSSLRMSRGKFHRDESGNFFLGDGLVGMIVVLVVAAVSLPFFGASSQSAQQSGMNALREADALSIADSALPTTSVLGKVPEALNIVVDSEVQALSVGGSSTDVMRNIGGNYQARLWADVSPYDEKVVMISAAVPRAGRGDDACEVRQEEDRNCLVHTVALDTSLSGVSVPNVADLNATGNVVYEGSTKEGALADMAQLRYQIDATPVGDDAAVIIRGTSDGTGEWTNDRKLVRVVDLNGPVGESQYYYGAVDIEHMKDVQISVRGASHDQNASIVFPVKERL